MRLTLGRRAGALAAIVALSAGGLLTAAGSASADDSVQLTTSNWVGIYKDANTSAKTGAADASPSSWIYAHCWKVGQSIGNWGNTWYQITYVWYNGASGWTYTPGYAFAGYVDNNAHTVNRDSNIPQC
ncbi:hypothetical protein [Kitasatospora sp. NPDC059571]|uniref:hypothetical protein n=1 Tax=Kitasatospora sp. NPDC059571 TaxID=3346871 RepID=UPI00367DF057